MMPWTFYDTLGVVCLLLGMVHLLFCYREIDRLEEFGWILFHFFLTVLFGAAGLLLIAIPWYR